MDGTIPLCDLVDDWKCIRRVFVVVIRGWGNGVAQYSCRWQEERSNHYSVIAKGTHRGLTMRRGALGRVQIITWLDFCRSSLYHTKVIARNRLSVPRGGLPDLPMSETECVRSCLDATWHQDLSEPFSIYCSENYPINFLARPYIQTKMKAQ
jgi:hypothetical protein